MKIVVFGDSICVGQLVNPHKTWVHKLSSEICGQFNHLDINISNASKSGDTTRMGLDRQKMQVGATSVDIFYTQFGLNDSNQWHDEAGLPRCLPDTFSENLYEILVRARAWGATKLMVGTNHLVSAKPAERWPTGAPAYPDAVKSYNELIRKVAIRADAELVDHEQHWITNNYTIDDNVMKDGVHLGLGGHEKYFELVKPHFFKAVQEFIESSSSDEQDKNPRDSIQSIGNQL